MIWITYRFTKVPTIASVGEIEECDPLDDGGNDE